MQGKMGISEILGVAIENGPKAFILSEFLSDFLQKGLYLQRFLWWELPAFRYLCSRI